MLRRLLIATACAVLAACGGSAGLEPNAQNPDVPPTFDELAKRSEDLSFKAAYKVSVSGGDRSVAAEYTMYIKPPQYRVDVTGMYANPQSVFVLEDAAYGCEHVGGTTRCVAVPRQSALDQMQLLQQQRQLNPEGQYAASFDRTYEGTRQIAGARGYCYAVKPKTDAHVLGITGKLCYGAQGLPLFLQTQFLGIDITLEATSFSAQVSDTDFKLPAVPTSR
jgi:hypothetical protein